MRLIYSFLKNILERVIVLLKMLMKMSVTIKFRIIEEKKIKLVGGSYPSPIIFN